MMTKRELPPKSERKIEPFRMFGNVYFVGTYAESSHVIDTGEGLIMIDTGAPSNLTVILAGLQKLGFAPTDVKYIINSHWHWDHTESTRAMVELSGAKGKEIFRCRHPHFRGRYADSRQYHNKLHRNSGSHQGYDLFLLQR